MKGVIKFFNSVKGFGFIKTEDKEYFFHISEILNKGNHVLKEGDEVEFQTAHDPKGDKAVEVEIK